MSRKELLVETHPKSSISEAIKTIRTNLSFSAVDKKIKTIMITSSVPSEGKSFVSANLAVAFAKIGKKVLIVDCDMRKGRQHKIFMRNGDKGLSNYLIDEQGLNYTCFVQTTDIENVHIMTRGIIPPNPSELLVSNKNKSLLEKVKNDYDITIFDSVPVNGLSDSLILAPLIDTTIIVTALNETPVELINNTRKSLENTNCNIAGVVVNKVPRSEKSYYNYYYYYEE